MPKRILDGEALWTSRKLKAVSADWIRAEYANLLPLALANGIFEADPELIWSRVYSFNRELLPAEIAQMLTQLERVDLIRRWTEPDGKVWGYFVGINKPGRLAPASQVKAKHFRTGPPPPENVLRGNTGELADRQCLDNVKALSTPCSCIGGEGKGVTLRADGNTQRRS